MHFDSTVKSKSQLLVYSLIERIERNPEILLFYRFFDILIFYDFPMMWVAISGSDSQTEVTISSACRFCQLYISKVVV